MSAGAYSRKYQAIEREKMKELKDREKKLFKERATYLSIQTTQRQKALEEKKRAMIEAEEERRKKALEDRRRSQQQATDRFRSTMGRMKSRNSTTVKNLGVLAKTKNSKCSHMHQVPPSVEPILDVKYGYPRKASERFTAGAVMVEKTSGLQQKTLSLDDVLDQLKGGNSYRHNLSDVTEHTVTELNIMPSDNSTPLSLTKKKSASDSNLNLLSRTENVSSKAQSVSSKAQSTSSESTESRETIKSETATSDSSSTVIAQPLLKTISVPPQPKTYHSTPMFSVADERDEPNSPTPPDSLNSSIASNDEPNSPSSNKSYSNPQKSFCMEDSDTSIADSLNEGTLNTHPVRPRLQSIPAPQKVSTSKNNEVVGILKKTSRSQSLPSSYYDTRFRRSDVASISSTSNETVAQNQGNGNTSKLQKRVRFSDQVETSERNNSPVVMNIADSVQIELWKRVFPKEFPTQSVRNSAFTPRMKCSLSSKPGSSQGTSRKPPNGTISVHVPAAAIDEYVSPPTTALRMMSPNFKQTQHNMEIKDITDSDSDENTTEPTANISLEKTPTDAEINTMWDQIRHCLHDGRKMPVPPRVFNFKPPSENGRRTLTTSYRTTDSSMDPSLTTPSSAKLLSNMSTGTSAQPSGVRKSNMNYTTRKQLVYRQPNHSMLSRRTERQPRPSEILPVRREKNRLLSDIQPSSKEPAKSGGTSNASMVALSLEEQRLMQSIERINQRLQDHLQGASTSNRFSPVPPSTPPNKQAQTMRTRVFSEPNTRNRLVSRVTREPTLDSSNHSTFAFPKSSSSHIT